MFDSVLLDRLSRVHPMVPLVLFLPAIALLLALGQEGAAPVDALVLVVGGYGPKGNLDTAEVYVP